MNWKKILLSLAALVIICIALLGILALLNRHSQVVGLNQEIQYDDFAFAALGARQAATIGNVSEPQRARGVYAMVTMKIANHARRVDFTFDKSTVILVDEQGNEYHWSADVQRAYDPARLPAHVAIIMDGNGRWAARRNLPRIAGHRAGADAVRRAVETAARLRLECLTLYAFSTENWKRPRLEVRALMDLLMEFLRKELKALRDNNIRFRLIGRSDGLHISVLEQIRRAELATMQNTGLQLNIAINYGGRTELVDACRRIAEEVAAGRLRPEEINEQVIESKLYTRML